MNYSSVLSAVIAALAAETRDNTSKQAWQKLYNADATGQADACVLGGERFAGIDPAQIACWMHARLRTQLAPCHWRVLQARYGTHKARKVEAISALIAQVNCAAPRLFVYKAVTAWAIPPLKGLKAGSQGVRRSTDIIVLPDGFYDISTWDTQGLSRTTYWRWKKSVEATLDQWVGEALAQAETVLLHEGILFSKTA
ncbi:putative uncharacterized protein [Pseudomonas sp. StFLB209]|uniref:hypothetical protein n=1 Tax=Pseudomonas sp. StFLB209 TaxID=1028989 RepID=UPI0004F61146|nr:hypothetical protein [Pseudomonas sp. StFLB209]BAP44486.1 putative uncharacterized protein [Pseudomonas sp. StFLB209]